MSLIFTLSLLFQILLYHFLVTCSELPSVGDEICLYKPYVTSVISISHTSKQIDNRTQLNFTMNLVLNDAAKVRIENLIMDLITKDKPEFHVNRAKITWQGNATDEETLKIPRAQYKNAKKLYEKYKGSIVTMPTSVCSPLIFDSEFNLKDENGKSVNYKYRDNHLCRTEELDPNNTTIVRGGPLAPFRRISAIFPDKNHLFIFEPDGRFKWYYYNSSAPELTDFEFMNNIKPIRSSHSFSTERTSSKFESFTIVANNKCKRTIINFENGLNSSSKSLLSLDMPMRFITRDPSGSQSGDKRWIFLEETLSDKNFRSWSSNGLEDATVKGIHGPRTKLFQLVALSYLPKDSSTFEQKSTVFESEMLHTQLMYLINTTSQYSHTRSPKLYPQDIVHWSTCKKVVSFYGYLYTMHKFGRDFIEEPSELHLLDQDLSSFPIEAVHAEGNEFWFFSSLWDVDVMIADPSNCNRLNLKRKSPRQHLFGLFNITSARRPESGLGFLSPLDIEENENTGLSTTTILLIICMLVIVLVGSCLAAYLSQRSRAAQQLASKRFLKSSKSLGSPKSIKSIKTRGKTSPGTGLTKAKASNETSMSAAFKTVKSSNSLSTPKSPKSAKAIRKTSPGKGLTKAKTSNETSMSAAFKTVGSSSSLPMLKSPKSPKAKSKASPVNKPIKIHSKKSTKQMSPLKQKTSKDTSMSTAL